MRQFLLHPRVPYDHNPLFPSAYSGFCQSLNMSFSLSLSVSYPIVTVFPSK